MVDQVDDGELRHVGTRKQWGVAKQKIETDCALVLHGDRVANQYSISAEYCSIQVQY